MKISLSLTFVVAVSACGSSSPPPAPAAPAPHASAAPSVTPSVAAVSPSTPFAPTPYTTEQLRKATVIGRTYEFRTEVAGASPKRVIIGFTKVSDTEAETRSALLDDKGTELAPPKLSVASWDELRRHAEFPRSATVIADERITVPAGAYECARYTVTEASGDVSTFYFAKSMPGPPVLFMTDKAGVRVMTTTLIRYVSGVAASPP